MTCPIVFLVAAATVGLADTAKGEVRKSDKELLQGAWVLFAGVRKGKVLTPEEFQQNDPEPLKRLIISGDSFAFEIEVDDETTTLRKFRYVLDTSRTPKTIDLLRKKDGGNPYCIYTVDENEFRLCYRNGPGERPAAFNTKSDLDVEVLIFRRQKP
jgi:uncharacterized protein (TIGR03067 family)